MSEQLWAWGWGEFGRLGNGDTTSSHHPSPIQAFKGKRIAQISSGAHHNLALGDQGDVYSWGYGADNQLGTGDTKDSLLPVVVVSGRKVVHISAGISVSFAVTDMGEVFSWGKSAFGQLGHGESADHVNIPRTVQSLSGVRITQIACGSTHCLALSDDGRVLSWGGGSRGQLGTGVEVKSCKEILEIESLRGSAIIYIACGAYHSLALAEAGRLFTWGDGSSGALGHGDTESCSTPVSVDSLEHKVITQMSGGGHHSAAVTDAGELFTWGAGRQGELGHGDQTSHQSPKMVIGLAKVWKVACGDSHTVTLTEEGRVHSFGNSDDGQLGLGNTNCVIVPRLVESLKAFCIGQISCGLCHVVALKAADTQQSSDSGMQEKLKKLTLRLQSAEVQLQNERRLRIVAEKRLEEVTAQLAQKTKANALRIRAGSTEGGGGGSGESEGSTRVVRDVEVQTEGTWSEIKPDTSRRRLGGTTRLSEELMVALRRRTVSDDPMIDDTVSDPRLPDGQSPADGESDIFTRASKKINANSGGGGLGASLEPEEKGRMETLNAFAEDWVAPRDQIALENQDADDLLDEALGGEEEEEELTGVGGGEGARYGCGDELMRMQREYGRDNVKTSAGVNPKGNVLGKVFGNQQSKVLGSKAKMYFKNLLHDIKGEIVVLDDQ